MYRPDHEYQCLLGIFEPLSTRFTPRYMYDDEFERVIQTAADGVGSTNIFNFTSGNSPKALLIARPFRHNRNGGYAWVEHYVSGSGYVVEAVNLYSSGAETPRLVWLPDNVRRVVFNIEVEDMGYDISWYDSASQITDECDKDFINSLGLYFMYDAKPYYSKFQVVKEADSSASTGRFLRDKVTTDLAFRGADFDKLVDDSVSEYAICAVAFYERFEDDPTLDYMAACCYFNRADAEVNFSECYVKPKFNTLDNYSWLLDKYSVEKNMVSIGAATKRMKIPIPPIIQIYTLGANAVTNICNDTCWEQEVTDPDISVNDLLKCGFRYANTNNVASQMPHFATQQNESLWFVIWERRTFGTDRYLFYIADPQTREYVYFCKSNYDPDPTDEFPYDELRFRYNNGAVEYYNPNTGRVLHSTVYSGNWLPHNNEYLDEDFGEFGGISWSGVTSEVSNSTNLQYTHVSRQPIWVRVLMYSADAPDRYAIGDFATPSPWYNKIVAANPVQLFGSNYTGIDSWLKFQESNDHTKKPTEYGLYQPDLYYTNENLTNYSYLSGLKPLPILKSWWGDYSFWCDLKGDTVSAQLATWTTYVEVRDCFPLDEVIRKLLNSYGIAFNFTNTYANSRLLYGSTGQANYIKNRYTYLVPATNITRGKYTQAAQKAMISLKDLLDEICNACNAGWHIDKDGLHIEGNEWYDAGHTYNGFDYYDPTFNFEDIADEFNDTNILYGQIGSTANTDKLWHTLSLNAGDQATKHFKTNEMQAKAPFCKAEDSISPKLEFDLLQAVATEGVSSDSILCIGTDSTYTYSYHSGGTIYIVTAEKADIFATTIYEAKVGSVSTGVAARIMNKSFSWPYLKGRYMFGLPADVSLIYFGWLQSAEYFSTMAKAYVKPHRSMKIRMPIISELYTKNWSLVKTTLGYGVISRIDTDMIDRVADVTVDILEY